MRHAIMTAATAVAMAAATAANAADKSPFDRPDPAPGLAYLQSMHIKLTAIGEEHGMLAYLGVHDGDRKKQVFYLTPDGQAVIAGLEVEAGGLNVTGIQLGRMKKAYEDAHDRPSSFLSPLDGKPVEPQVHPSVASTPVASAPAAATPGPAALPPAAPIDPSTRYVSSRTADDLKTQVRDRTGWINVGSPRSKDAPVVYMVADPQCPYCHATWLRLRDMVATGKISVTFILINGLPGSESLALSILSQPDPGRAWYQGEGSVDNHPISSGAAEGTPALAKARSALALNDAFAKSIDVRRTPWVAYVGKDGKVREKMGADDLDGFLSGL